MGVTLNSMSSKRKQAGAECLLLDSGAQLHACPITYPGQKIPLPDPGIHIASVNRTPSQITFSRVYTLISMSHVTLAQSARITRHIIMRLVCV